MSGSAVPYEQLSPCAGSTGKIGGSSYSVRYYLKGFVGSGQLFYALNGDASAAVAAYLSAAGSEKIRKAAYLRLSCSV